MCRRAELEEGCLTVALGDVDLAEGLEDLSEDRTEATDTATGLRVAVECYPVVVNPGGLAPGSSGTVQVGTRFVVDVECRALE